MRKYLVTLKRNPQPVEYAYKVEEGQYRSYKIAQIVLECSLLELVAMANEEEAVQAGVLPVGERMEIPQRGSGLMRLSQIDRIA